MSERRTGSRGIPPCVLGEYVRPASLPAEPGAHRRILQPPGAGLGFGGEFGGALPRRAGGLVAAPALRAPGDSVEVGRHAIIKALRCQGQMPRPPIKIAGKALREDPMYPLLLNQGRRPINGRAHERVPEPQLRTPDPDQPGSFSHFQSLSAGAERRRRRADRRDLAGAVCRGDQQQGLSFGGQPTGSIEERPLHPGRERKRVRKPRLAGQLVDRQHSGQFDQRQRAAARLRHQRSTDLSAHRLACPLGEQSTRGRRIEAAQDQLGKPIAVKCAYVTLAGTEDERHPVGQQPSGDEQQRLSRRRVQPLSVIHDGDDRAFLRGLAQQAQRRDEDDKPVRDGALLLAERSA